VPLPEPPNFLGMALQMGEQKRRREQDALQNMLIQQQQQDRIERMGIEAIQAGWKLKDIEARYGTEASEQMRAGWRIYSDAQKRKQQEAESGAAAQPIAANLQTLAQSGAQNTEAYGQGVSSLAQMLGPERSTPIFESLSTQAQMAPTMSALAGMSASRAADAKVALEGRIEAQKNAMAAARELQVYGRKKGIDRANQDLDVAILQSRTAAVTPWVQSAIEAERSGGSPAAVQAITQAAESIEDPIERGVQTQHAIRIWNMGREKREIAEGFPIRIPKGLVSRIQDGTATEDYYTGLVLNVKPGSENEESVAFTQGAYQAAARMDAALERFASKGGVEGSALYTGSVERLAKTIGAQDPDFAYIDQARNSLLELARRRLAGANLTQNEEAFYNNLIPKLERLSFQKGKLTPQSVAALKGMISHLETSYGANVSSFFPTSLKVERLRARYAEAKAAATEEFGPVSAAPPSRGSVLIPARGQ
jgi:hypothetical protein